MKSTHFFSIAIRIIILAPLAGCASIMSGRHAEVAIHTNPPNAHVVVRDKRGQEVASVNTPGKVALRRKDKFIFPARYTATIAAPGYQTAQVPIRSTVNPWILGNVVLGGIPGLVVDNVTGAAWKPRDADIYQELMPIYTPQPTQPYSAIQPAGYVGEQASPYPTELSRPQASVGSSTGIH